MDIYQPGLQRDYQGACQTRTAHEARIWFLAGYIHLRFAYLFIDMGMSTVGNKSSNGDARIQATIRLRNGLCLLFRKPELKPWQYPSCRIQKGLIIASNSRELSSSARVLRY